RTCVFYSPPDAGGVRGGILLLTHTSLPASPYARGGVKRVSPNTIIVYHPQLTLSPFVIPSVCGNLGFL
ncbi:MAG: hypothetical protein AAB968_00595, partial [Patescibacteria group bacterium]